MPTTSCFTGGSRTSVSSSHSSRYRGAHRTQALREAASTGEIRKKRSFSSIRELLKLQMPLTSTSSNSGSVMSGITEPPESPLAEPPSHFTLPRNPPQPRSNAKKSLTKEGPAHDKPLPPLPPPDSPLPALPSGPLSRSLGVSDLSRPSLWATPPPQDRRGSDDKAMSPNPRSFSRPTPPQKQDADRKDSMRPSEGATEHRQNLSKVTSSPSSAGHGNLDQERHSISPLSDHSSLEPTADTSVSPLLVPLLSSRCTSRPETSSSSSFVSSTSILGSSTPLPMRVHPPSNRQLTPTRTEGVAMQAEDSTTFDIEYEYHNNPDSSALSDDSRADQTTHSPSSPTLGARRFISAFSNDSDLEESELATGEDLDRVSAGRQVGFEEGEEDSDVESSVRQFPHRGNGQIDNEREQDHQFGLTQSLDCVLLRIKDQALVETNEVKREQMEYISRLLGRAVEMCRDLDSAGTEDDETENNGQTDD